MKITSGKNIKFNASFVMDNLESMRKVYSFKSGVLTLIKIAERDGLKCDCCKLDVHFRLHQEHGMLMYTPENSRLTMDHDLLNSLEGSDHLDNQHLLCYKCNQLRGNRFAEYKEFKDWYDSVGQRNGNPYHAITRVKRNFSYLDLAKNGFTKDKLDEVIFISKFRSGKDHMPEEFKLKLYEHFYKHQSFLNIKGVFTHCELISYSRFAWDEFINELMMKLIKLRMEHDIELPTKKYQLLSNNAMKSIDKFIGALNHVVKTEYKLLRDPIALNIKKNKALQATTAMIELVVTSPVQDVQEEVTTISWLSRFMNSIKTVFA